MKMIPYSRHTVTREDRDAVMRVLRSDWLTQGPAITEFEEKLARACGAKYAVAVSNGTAALHLACLALGVSPGQQVITTPHTFAASSNCVLYCGGEPVFADVDTDTLNLDPEKFQKAVTARTRGVIPVHFAGLPCDMEPIARTAKQNKLFVLEDGSHALGARYRSGGRWHKVGSCVHADACVFSFHPVKGITTGEGGAVTTNRRDLYDRICLLRTHGITKEAVKFCNTDMAFYGLGSARKTAGWYYEMQALGFNYRIPDILCALGTSQLKRLPSFIKRRREIAAFYNKALRTTESIELPLEPEGLESAYHLYVIRLRQEKLKAGRAEIFEALRQAGLGVQVHYIPVPLQPYYRSLGYRRGLCPVAESQYERIVSIPVYPSLTPALARLVVKRLQKVLRHYEA